MRVLQLISSNGFFGAENVIIQIAKELIPLNYNICIGIIGNNNLHGEFENAAMKNNLSVKVFNCNGKFDFSTVFELRNFIKRNKIDIIHSHGYKSNFYGFLCSINTYAKRIGTCHNWIGTSIKMRGYKYFDKILLRKFDKVVVVSMQLEKELIDSGISRNKIILINNGIDIEKFKPIPNEIIKELKHSIGIKIEDKVIGIIGRLSSEKGHAYLLQAFKIISSEFPRTKLVIVGDGPLGLSLKRQARDYGIEDKTFFLGSRDDVSELLSIFDVFVLVSLVEGMPMALLEAMAARKPVIATRVGAIPSIVKDQYSGLLIDPQNTDQIVSAIKDLFSNKDKGGFIADNGFQTVKDNFSLKSTINKYINVFETTRKKT